LCSHIDGSRLCKDRPDNPRQFVGQGDDGSALEINGNVSDLTVQASGNFSGSATVGLEGSNDGSNWAPIPDETGSTIALGSAAVMAGVSRLPPMIRPIVSGGDVSTDIDLNISFRTSP